MRQGDNFFNLYNHDFVRVAVGVPAVRVADPAFNAEQTIALMRAAAERQAVLALFPELGLSAYSCDDLFHQRALLDECRAGIAKIVAASITIPLIAVVGVPLEVGNLLFNCAVVIGRGRILGVVPKTYLPNYREFYEARQFNSGENAVMDAITLCGQRDIPFGSRILFQHDEQPLFTFHAEICEDLWVPLPPSSYAALAGATVLLNLSASNITIGKAAYRRELVLSQSARCLAAYLYSAAGPGESTTDLAWDGHALIAENGNLIGESIRFKDTPQLVYADLDLERLAQERMRQTTFGQAVRHAREELRKFRTVGFATPLPRQEPLLLDRQYERFPYVPADPAGRGERCAEVYEIQVQGLVSRLRATGIKRVVIGISGGIDSTQALLVCAQVIDRLGYPRGNVRAYTMPGFATSDRTLAQARRLMAAIGCEAHEVDIENALVRHITRFLLELGAGFAFVGRQFRIEVEGDEFFIDLLCYHLKLRSYVVIELKAGKFSPEDLGQLGFYLTAVDRQIRSLQDNQTIGLLLCKSKNKIVAEYALSDKTQPMGVAEFKLLEAMLQEIQSSLPSIDQIERELADTEVTIDEQPE